MDYFLGRRLRNGEPCSTPGFFGDAEDCRIFYRCAEHPTEDENNPYLIRFKFRCPNGTVFDEALSTCNHPEAVMDKPANCQVYDPPEEEQPMDSNGGEDGSSGTPPPSIFNQFLVRQTLQQQQPVQTLLLPYNQLLYPTLSVPSYGNFIQYG